MTSLIKDEKGFVLIATMMVLVILTLIGISATRSTYVELLISGNDKVHKQTFYQADGSSELAERLLFENAVCSVTQSTGFTPDPGTAVKSFGDTILVEDLIFANNLLSPLPLDMTPSDANRHLVIYPAGSIAGGSIIPGNVGAANDALNPERTNVRVQGRLVPIGGSSLGMVSAYDGLAYSATSGTARNYAIGTEHQGQNNSRSLINTRWRLNINVLNSASSFDCGY